MTAAPTTPDQDMLRLARCVCDVLVIPGAVLPFDGQAWRWEGRAFITVASAARGPALARVIAHELAHHALDHTRHWDSRPMWRKEYDAEEWALDLLTGFVDAASLAALRADSHAYLRRCLQPMLDAGITVHGEIEVGLLLGCEIDAELLAIQAERMAPDAACADDGEIAF